MIKTLSSYYLDIPFVSPLTSLTSTSIVIKLYVWNGLKTSAPTEATYTLTEQNPEALTTNLSVNIAKLINDFIDFTPQVITTNYQDGNNQVWVKSEVFYNTENTSEASTPQLLNVYLAVKGYGYAMEGLNPQLPTDKILLTNREFKVNSSTKFIVPILLDESATATPSLEILTITSVGGTDYDITFTTVGTFTELDLYIDSVVGLIEVDTFGITSPQTFDLGTETGDLEFYLGGLDSVSNSYVYSPVFLKTI